MQPWTLVCDLPAPICDAAPVDGRHVVALGASVVVIERGAVTRSFTCPARHLVSAADARSVLCVSPVIDPPEHHPLRRISPPEERRRTRQVWRLAAPWERPQPLGVAEVEGFSPTYDGRLWPTYEGDDVRLLACAGDRIEVAAEHASFWPTAIERTPDGVWLETSSLGMSHFEALALPTLAPRERGDLRLCPLEFPPEQVTHALHSPALAHPIFAVDAAAIPVSCPNRHMVTHPIRGVHRVATLDRVLTPLPTPAAGLVGAGERALCWTSDARGTQLLTIDLAAAQVTARRPLDEPQVGARLFGRTALLWSRAAPPGRPHRLLTTHL